MMAICLLVISYDFDSSTSNALYDLLNSLIYPLSLESKFSFRQIIASWKKKRRFGRKFIMS
jgi:hypothetical protein